MRMTAVSRREFLFSFPKIRINCKFKEKSRKNNRFFQNFFIQRGKIYILLLEFVNRKKKKKNFVPIVQLIEE